MKKLFLALALWVMTASAYAYTLEISEKELQSHLAAIMPIEKKQYIFTIILSNPLLDLLSGENKIAVVCDIKVKSYGGVQGTGKVKITGTIAYSAKKAAFYFYKPKIIYLKVDQIPESMHAKLQSVAQKTLSKYMASRPIYRFQDKSLKHKLAKSVLKSVIIKDEKLIVTLKIF